MRNRPFLDRRAALARLSRNTEAGILFNEPIADDGPTSSRTPAGLALTASCRRRSMAAIDPTRAASGSRSAIPPASPCSGSGVSFGIDNPENLTFLLQTLAPTLSEYAGAYDWSPFPQEIGRAGQ
jgi:hypothetical protein